MKSILMTVIVALGVCDNLQAQVFQWAYTYGHASTSNRALAVTTDASGYMYTAGFFKDLLDFDPGPDSVKVQSTGSGNAFILKMDAAGKHVKTYVFGTGNGARTTAGNMKFDAVGNLFTAGYFTGSNVDFDPDTSTFKITDIGSGNNAFVMKMDAAGKFAWVKHWNYNRDAGGGNGMLEEGPAMTLDPSGNVLTAGRFYGTVDFDPGATTRKLIAITENGYISKLDAAGNFLWAKQLIADTPVIKYVFPQSITTDPSGNIYVAGNFIGTADFNPDSSASFTLAAQEPNGFVMKLDASGNFIWAKKIGNDNSPLLNSHGANAVIADAAGNVYVTGGFMDKVDFGGTQLTSAGLGDIYLAKLDGSGAYLWAKSVGSIYDNEEGTRLTLDASGDLCMTGVYHGTVDFDAASSISISTNGASDVFIARFTPGGKCIWARGYGGSDSYEYIQSVAVRGADIYTVGRMVGTVNFDPGGYYPLSSGSANTYYPNFFIHKMVQNPAGIHGTNSLTATVSPNPATTQFIIKLSGSGSKSANISLFDMQGRKVLEQSMTGTTASVRTEDLAKGTYLLKIQRDDTYATRTLIVE
jgi:hypothetical protein